MKTMKKFAALLFVLTLSFLSARCQQLKVERVDKADNINMNDFVHALSSFEYYFLSDTLSVSVLFHCNPSGSAKRESCEITRNLFFSTSEDGEYPEHHLFVIRNIYGASKIYFSDEDLKKSTIRFTYIDQEDQDKKKEVSLKVGLRMISISKTIQAVE